MGFNPFKRRKTTKITVINLKLQGFNHTMDGMESKEDKIEIKIPFTNKLHTDMLTDAGVFKAQKGKPIKIEKIVVSEPFEMVSITPGMPVEVPPGGKTEFKIMLKPPAHSYAGPLSISFASEQVEMVHIELSRTLIEHNGKRIEIPASSRMLNIEKGKIFTEKVQLFKALGYGETAKEISVSFPFKLISTDPPLPATINDANSYIMSMHIQAPSQNYSGEMVLTIV